MDFGLKLWGKFHPKMDSGACLGCLEELKLWREGLGISKIPVGNQELLPTLPCLASASGIPINFGIISLKTTTEKEKQNKSN